MDFSSWLTRAALRRHDHIEWAVAMFGPYYTAEEVVRRYREECEQAGCKFERDYVIGEAAKKVGLPEDKLRNWLLRSRKIRDHN